jgi:hypothetical protein
MTRTLPAIDLEGLYSSDSMYLPSCGPESATRFPRKGCTAALGFDMYESPSYAMALSLFNNGCESRMANRWISEIRRSCYPHSPPEIVQRYLK